MIHNNFSGAGLGLRTEFFSELTLNQPIDFLEVAPENWMKVGGRLGKQFREFVSHYPLVCHGLSLSIAGPDPLNIEHLKNIKQFLDEFNVLCYSEHLSYCTDEKGYLYDLFPIPFSEEAVRYVSDRIKHAQEILERKIAFENISYYYEKNNPLTESEFINAIVETADCEILFDVNNVYVNSINHGYDPVAFIRAMPQQAIPYYHIAGHLKEKEDLLVDTHGAPVISPVWSLLEETYKSLGIKPTLLERDHHIPSLTALTLELDHIRDIQKKCATRRP